MALWVTPLVGWKAQGGLARACHRVPLRDPFSLLANHSSSLLSLGILESEEDTRKGHGGLWASGRGAPPGPWRSFCRHGSGPRSHTGPQGTARTPRPWGWPGLVPSSPQGAACTKQAFPDSLWVPPTVPVCKRGSRQAGVRGVGGGLSLPTLALFFLGFYCTLPCS